MTFGIGGLKATGKDSSIAKKTVYQGKLEVIPDAGKKLFDDNLKGARAEARARGLTLVAYFKLPKEERNF